MKNKKPSVKHRTKVCIICEGNEEYAYIKKLCSLKLFAKDYDIDYYNAKSISKIFAVYQSKVQEDNFHVVVIFCDTDSYPYEQYKKLKDDIKNYYGITSNKNLPETIFFGNPCTMQIILSHFDVVKLKSHLKSVNAPTIERLTGVKDYEATEHQIESIMKKIDKDNVEIMKINVGNLSKKDNVKPSSNFIMLINNLTTYSNTWIELINSKL